MSIAGTPEKRRGGLFWRRPDAVNQAEDDAAEAIPSLEESTDVPAESPPDKGHSPRLSRKERKAAKKAAKVIPSLSMLTRIRRVVDQCIEDTSGNRYAVWSVAGLDSTSDQVINGWLTMLNSLEFPIQILIRQHAPDTEPIRQKFVESRPEKMFAGRVGEVADSALDMFRSFEQGGRVVERWWYVIAGESKALEISSVMAQAGFTAERLGTARLQRFLSGCLSGMGEGHSQPIYQVQEYSKSLTLNERCMAVYEVHKWPRRISLMFLEHLLRSGEEMDLSMWIWPVSARESHTRLQTQRARFEGSRLASLQKGKLVSPEVELAISDIVRISEEVERGVSRLFRRTLTLAIYAHTEQDLRRVGEKVTGHFRSSLAGARLMRFRQGKGYHSMMPAVRRGLGSMDLTDSGTMLRLFPFGPQDLNDGEGTLLGLDLRSRTPVMFDPFSPKAMNGHMVVMARSGAGKSFFTKLRVLRESLRGIPIYLIDPEGEYGVITRALGGDVFVPGASGHGLNPFLVGYTDENDLTNRIQGLGSLVGVMLEGELDQSLKASIDECLTAFYARELVSVSGWDQDGPRILGRGGMQAFHSFLESPDAKELGGGRLSHLLSRFATGSSRFLMRGDARSLLEYEAPVTSFNLKHLSGPMKPVATSVCSEVVWALAVSRPRPRLLVVDECWTVLATPSGAESLINIVKRARKYQLGLMTITQDVQDFLAENQGASLMGHHAGRSLLQNSATKLAFSQDPAALPQVVEALGLSEDVGMFLAGALRGQGVLVGESGTCYPIDVISTDQERELITDESWRQDGELLPMPETESEDGVRDRELATMLHRHVELTKERVAR